MVGQEEGANLGVRPSLDQRANFRAERRSHLPAPTEAADLAGLSTRAIYRAIQRGELRAVRLCSRLRIAREDFDDWVARAAVRVEPRVVEVRAVPAERGSFRRLLADDEEDGVMSVERVERKDGSVVWRVRWRQGGRNRSKVLGRKRDADAFDAELVRRKRTGELAQLDAGKETLAEFGEEWWRLYAEPNLARVDAQGLREHVGRARAAAARLDPAARADAGRDQPLPPGARGRRRRARVDPQGARRAPGRPAARVRVGAHRVEPGARRCASRRSAAREPSCRWRPRPSRRSVTACCGARLVRDATLVSVLAYAGLRPGEALALHVGARARAHAARRERACRSATIEATKTGRRRTVPLLGPLGAGPRRVAAARAAARAPTRSSSPATTAAPWTLTAYQNWRRRIYTPAARRRASRSPRPYDLRHSFVSLLIAEGHNVVEVARQAGHSPTMALDTYAHVFEEFDPAERSQRRRPHPQGARGAALPRPAADAIRRRMTAALDTYAELRLAEGKLLRWGERDRKAEVALQPRDLEILVALARYRFLTTGQIAELWWEGRGLRAVRRRMTRLFEAGFVERFRPQTLRGSYQWTYCLARDGFRAAQQTGELAPSLKFAPRREAIFDYRYVIHDLRANEWVLRYRELLGDRLLDWAGPDESRSSRPRRAATRPT